MQRSHTVKMHLLEFVLDMVLFLDFLGIQNTLIFRSPKILSLAWHELQCGVLFQKATIRPTILGDRTESPSQTRICFSVNPKHLFYEHPESIEEPNIAKKVPYQEQTLVNFLINLSNITSTPFGRIIKRALNLNPTSFHFKLRKWKLLLPWFLSLFYSSLKEVSM